MYSNQVINPGAETGNTAGWNVPVPNTWVVGLSNLNSGNGCSSSMGYPHSGSQFFGYCPASPNVMYQDIFLSVGSTYLVSLWAANPQGNSKSFKLSIGNNILISQSNIPVTYTQYFAMYTASNNIESLQIIGSAPEPGSVNIDDISVVMLNPSATNLVINPGAETGNTAGWNVPVPNTWVVGLSNLNSGNGCSSSMGYPHSGSQFFGDCPASPNVMYQDIFLSVGSTYLVSLWAANPQGNSKSFKLSIGNNILISQSNIPVTYTQYFAMYTASNNIESLQIIGSAPEPGSVNIDDISITLLDFIVPTYSPSASPTAMSTAVPRPPASSAVFSANPTNALTEAQTSIPSGSEPTSKFILCLTAMYSCIGSGNNEFIINSQENIQVYSNGGNNKFDFYANANTIVTITGFNYLKDIIDLSAFSNVRSFNDLEISSNPTTINVLANQKIVLQNIIPSDLQEFNFIFSNEGQSIPINHNDNSIYNTQWFWGVVGSAVSIVGLCISCVGVYYGIKQYHIYNEISET